ncbi:hypothetical protein HMPREF0063_12392 [Aeromicrobium marinum DSM 15272]|uniref:Ribosome maturation factor RimP n=1 Tax=Aeromicrobium marinum DSM 15272 TaxID=585531 RepID=E2SD80_9ACTN|nr:ribosome maturation factor RimP [Aeromicrobium marinum]EFQ83183.1 hypothetical protein HMPREF0063_12392 [Aeromicrobium marinum DSM 15272]
MDERFTALVRSCVEPEGLELDDLTISAAGRKRVLRVALDSDDGVGIDQITAVTRALNAVLDDDPAAVAALGGTPYTLEVTSRGVSSPLTSPRHWRRNHGRLVKVELTDGAVETGRITSSTDTHATLAQQERRGAPTDIREIAYPEVARALVQVELNRKDA